jgi:hypothetical protein
MPIVFNNSNAANVQTPSVDKTTLFIANTQLATKDANGNVTYYNAGGNGSPGGVTTSVQFNNSGAFAGNGSFTFDEANSLLSVGNISVSGVSNLGNVSNVKISGGTANYVLSTDGSSNLSWVAQTGGGGNSSSIANGTTNIRIPTANGDILGNINGDPGIFLQATGATEPGENGSVRIGHQPYAGTGQWSTFIGAKAGIFTNATGKTAVGSRAQWNAGGEFQTSVGTEAGDSMGASANSVQMGYQAGSSAFGAPNSISIGTKAGYYGAAEGAVIIGHQAGVGNNIGNRGAGSYGIYLGAFSGANGDNSVNNSIVFNATGSTLYAQEANTFTVKPVRNDTGNVTNALYYNTITSEVTYGPGGGGPGRIAAIYVYTRSSGTVQVPVTGGYLNVVGRSAIIPIPVN